MAYDGNWYGAYSGRPAYQLRLYLRRYETSGNSSTYAWELLAERINTGTAWSSNATNWNVNIGGQAWSGNASLDFRSTTQLHLANGVAGWFGHDGNGYLNFGVSANHSGDSPFGWASLSGSFSADRIPQVPGAPYSVGITQIGPLSMVYQFSGTTDGGAAIDGWQAQIASDAGFTANVQTIASNGTTTFNSLTPGTKYYCRSRGHNGVGYSGWSDTMSATTLSGAFVGNSSNPTFNAAAVYVGKSGAFVLASVYVGSGGSFVVAS